MFSDRLRILVAQVLHDRMRLEECELSILQCGQLCIGVDSSHVVAAMLAATDLTLRQLERQTTRQQQQVNGAGGLRQVIEVECGRHGGECGEEGG